MWPLYIATFGIKRGSTYSEHSTSYEIQNMGPLGDLGAWPQEIFIILRWNVSITSCKCYEKLKTLGWNNELQFDWGIITCNKIAVYQYIVVSLLLLHTHYPHIRSTYKHTHTLHHELWQMLTSNIFNTIIIWLSLMPRPHSLRWIGSGDIHYVLWALRHFAVCVTMVSVGHFHCSSLSNRVVA